MEHQDGEDADTLLKHADIAMYAIRARGKGRYHFYQPALSASRIQRLALEQAQREAVDQDKFVRHYQPHADTVTGALRSLEVLQILRELGCDEVQGYTIARPLPAAAAARLLRAGSLFPDVLKSA